MLGLKKPLLLFIIAAIFILLMGLVYNRYCASKPDGCKDKPYEGTNLSDDHMDA